MLYKLSASRFCALVYRFYDTNIFISKPTEKLKVRLDCFAMIKDLWAGERMPTENALADFFS